MAAPSILPSFLTLQEVTSLVPENTLSKGKRTEVLVARDPKTNEEYVLKVGPYKSLVVEMECLAAVKKHPNLIQLIKYFQVGDYLVLQYEKGKGSSLTAHILKHGALNCQQTLSILQQLVSVLEHMHSAGWVHRDVKPDNIVYDSQTGIIKLIDFEFAGRWSKNSFLNQPLGSYKYSAPEVRAGGLYRGPEADMWSVGVTIFVLLFLKFPFSKKELSTFSESSQLLSQNMKSINSSSSSLSCDSIVPTSSSSSVGSSTRPYANTIANPSCCSLIPDTWCSMISSLMEVDTAKRMTLAQLKKQLSQLSKQSQQKRRNTDLPKKFENDIGDEIKSEVSETSDKKQKKPFKGFMSVLFRDRKGIFSRFSRRQKV